MFELEFFEGARGRDLGGEPLPSGVSDSFSDAGWIESSGKRARARRAQMEISACGAGSGMLSLASSPFLLGIFCGISVESRVPIRIGVSEE